MKNFLLIIRKSEFTDLFKYGYQHINANAVVEFDGNTYNLENDTEIKDRLFTKVNPFDYTFTVVIIHFKSKNDSPNIVYVEDVLHIYPLDADAKRQIEISYDSRIRLESPIWEKHVHELQELFLCKNSQKGVLNIWKLLKIEKNINDVKSILSNDDIRELNHEAFTNARPKGQFPFWIYLLRYERHGFFPKSSKGYFYDLINIYINFKSNVEKLPEEIENTAIYSFLEQIPDKADVSKVFDLLDKNETGQNFLTAINSCSTINADVAKTAILFLVFKQTFKEGFNLNKTSNKVIIHAKKKFPKEFEYVAYLLGIYLGHDHTFECLYEQLPLPIFKENFIVKNKNSREKSTTGKEDVDNNTPFQGNAETCIKDADSTNEGINYEDDKEITISNAETNMETSNAVEQVSKQNDSEIIDNPLKTPNSKMLDNYAGNKHVEQSSLFPEMDEDIKYPYTFPVQMKKKNDNGNWAGGKPKIIKTKEEYRKHIKIGYYEYTK